MPPHMVFQDFLMCFFDHMPAYAYLTPYGGVFVIYNAICGVFIYIKAIIYLPSIILIILSSSFIVFRRLSKRLLGNFFAYASRSRRFFAPI